MSPARQRRLQERAALETFTRAGLAVTPQRQLLLQIVSREKGHVPAEAVHKKARRSFPGISLTTVYDNLTRFEALGLIGRVLGPDGIAYFEADSTAHSHLICLTCGDIQDFLSDRFPMERLSQVSSGPFRIQSVVLQYHGVCGKCQGAKVVDLGSFRRSIARQQGAPLCKSWQWHADLKGI